MKCLQETTKDLRSHTYLVDKDKMVAYRKDTGEVEVFSKPMSFGKRYRTFKEVRDPGMIEYFYGS